MPRFIITGNYSAKAARGMLDDPSDREEATRVLVEAVGGKLLSFYITTGETDFMLVAEADDGADLVPVTLVAAASGSVSNLKTVRAYTGEEFKAHQKKAGKIASSYKPPAKAK